MRTLINHIRLAWLEWKRKVALDEINDLRRLGMRGWLLEQDLKHAEALDAQATEIRKQIDNAAVERQLARTVRRLGK